MKRPAVGRGCLVWAAGAHWCPVDSTWVEVWMSPWDTQTRLEQLSAKDTRICKVLLLTPPSLSRWLESRGFGFGVVAGSPACLQPHVLQGCEQSREIKV